MTGTLLNGMAILAGGIAGLAMRKPVSGVNQNAIKFGLALATIYIGFSMVWRGLRGPDGEFAAGPFFKQFGIVLLALILGNLTGKVLRIQKGLNRLGGIAKEHLARATANPDRRAGEGFVTCSLLFCVGPLAVLGPLQDGLAGDFRTLAIKAVMDGMAALAFAQMFGWGAPLSALPVVAYQGTLTLLARCVAPHLENTVMLGAFGATGGFLLLCVVLVILESKKVPLGDYLPALAWAPFLAWVWR